MEAKMMVSVNEKGQAVITHAMPLVDYCVKRAQTLRAMVELVSAGKHGAAADHACPVSSTLAKPLLKAIRAHIDELEPLFRAVDQHAYEKGFDDGKDVGYPRKNRPESAKEGASSAR